MKYLLFILINVFITTSTFGQVYIPMKAPSDSIYTENGKDFTAGLIIESRRIISIDGFKKEYKRFINSLDTSRYAITYSTIHKPEITDAHMVVIFRKVEKSWVVR
ncbi:hypothetical protein [Gracilimonas sediminicola]|uniref:Uncharacterized protein n=1 Tax=Gracilimonas sediminicola TaxID=2952158 RepID=A0A9X2L0L0_9BACT|nr:hypothetical protein [Gracilimonas sediminicola]MCP9289980.1 hypothetical protein [Gracilimonas sediminicola]